MHLLTREALTEYMRHLRPGGVVVFNVTNRYLDLVPAIATLASDLKLAARLFDTDGAKMSAEYPVRYKATWIALSSLSAAILRSRNRCVAGRSATHAIPSLGGPLTFYQIYEAGANFELRQAFKGKV